MKYKNFDAYFKAQKLDVDCLDTTTIKRIKFFMMDAWDACVNNHPVDEQKATIGEHISNLLNTISDAEGIPCTCDQAALKQGARCVCIRAGAIKQAGLALGNYLFNLRKELKK